MAALHCALRQVIDEIRFGAIRTEVSDETLARVMHVRDRAAAMCKIGMPQKDIPAFGEELLDGQTPSTALIQEPAGPGMMDLRAIGIRIPMLLISSKVEIR